MQDQPSSNGTSFPSVPRNTQSKTPQPVNTHPFVRPPLLSVPSAVATAPLNLRRLQVDNSATTPLNPRRLQVDNSAFQDGMFARLLTLLEEIKETQRVHGRMLQTLLSQCEISVLPQGAVFLLMTGAEIGRPHLPQRSGKCEVTQPFSSSPNA